jgi:FixJ family two-component response regulator
LKARPSVFVVDSDPAVCRDLTGAGKLMGAAVKPFASAEQFLEAYDPSVPGCLVVDIQLPGMSGLELQQHLAARGMAVPIVIVSAHADVRIAVEAMTRGAISVLQKPFQMSELLAAIRLGFERDSQERAAQARQTRLEAQRAQLTAKEQQVLDLIAAGKTNKQIAADLHRSVRAVEDRRARMMKKLGVRSLAELIRWREAAGAGES